MLRKSARLPSQVFVGRPKRRMRFEFGSVSFFDESPSRVAVVVSKKVARRAVDRNKIRRRALHALKALHPRLLASVVVYPIASARTVSFAKLRAALEEACISR